MPPPWGIKVLVLVVVVVVTHGTRVGVTSSSITVNVHNNYVAKLQRPNPSSLRRSRQ